MVTVQVQDGVELERALRKFRKEIDKEGILDECKERQYYEKPSTKKHRKNVTMARRRLRERQAKEKEEAHKPLSANEKNLPDDFFN